MAPAATANGTGAAAAFAAATSSIRQCILAHYQQGEAGKEAVRAAVQVQLEQGAETPVVAEAVEVAFRQVLNEDLMARALPAGKDVLVRRGVGRLLFAVVRKLQQPTTTPISRLRLLIGRAPMYDACQL